MNGHIEGFNSYPSSGLASLYYWSSSHSSSSFQLQILGYLNELKGFSAKSRPLDVWKVRLSWFFLLLMLNVYLTCTTKLRKCIINISSINVTVRSLWPVAVNKLISPYFWIANHFINRTVNIHNISYHCSIFKNLMLSKKQIHNTQKLTDSSIKVCRRQRRHKAN